MAKLAELTESAMYEKNLHQKKLKILQTVMSIFILVVSESNQQIVNLGQSSAEQAQQTNAGGIQSPINDTTISSSNSYLTPSSRSHCNDLATSSANIDSTTTLPLATQKRILGDESTTLNQTEDLLIQESQNNQSTFRFSSLAPEQIVDPITAPISNNNELFKNHNINNNNINKNIADLSSLNYESTLNATNAHKISSSQEPQYFKPPDEFLANYWLQDNNQHPFNHRLPQNESLLRASSIKQYSDNQDNSISSSNQGSFNSAALSNFLMPVTRQQIANGGLQQNLSLPSELIAPLSNLDKPDKHSMGLPQPINEPITASSENLQGLARHRHHAQSQQQRLLMEQLKLQKINNDLIRLASEQQKSQFQQQQQNYGYQLGKLATRQPQKIPKIYPQNTQLIYPSYLQSVSPQHALLNPRVKHIQLGRLLPFTNKLRHKKFHYQQTTTGKPLVEDLQTSAHSQDIQLDTPRDIIPTSQQQHQQQHNLPPSNSFTAHPIPLNHQQATVGADQLARLQAKANNPIFTKYTTLKNLRQAQLQSLADTIDPSASALLAASSIPSTKSRLQRFESMNSQIPAASGFNPQNALEIGEQGPSTMSYSLLPSGDSQADADNALTGLDQDQFIKALQQSAALGAPSPVQEVAQDPVGASDAALASLFETMLKNAINSTNIHKPSDTMQSSSAQSSSSHNSNQQQAQQSQQQSQTQQNHLQSNTNFLNNQSPLTSSKFNLHNNQQQMMNYPNNQLSGITYNNHQGGLIPPPPLMGDDPLQQHQHHSQLHGPGNGPDSLQLADNNYQMYDQMPQQRKRKKSKKRNKNGANGAGGSSKQPQIRVAKRPRTGTGNPGFYDVNSQNDLEPSATFHKWKYPWLYGPNAGAFRPGDEDEEEEGETEVNIRFFNNFSRMGPFGQLTRAGGTATLVVSLAFLIISNISLAATVIAHGISSFLRNHSAPDRTKTIVRKRETTAMPAAQKGSVDLSFYSSSILDNNNSLRSSSTAITTKTTNTTTGSSTTTSTTMAPSTELDEKIKSFGREWET